MKYCLDTNIISYLLGGDTRYDNLITKYMHIESCSKNEICTSIIVVGEIAQGLKQFEIEYVGFAERVKKEKLIIENKYLSDDYNSDEFLKLEESNNYNLEKDLAAEKLKHQLRLEQVKKTNRFLQEISTYGVDRHTVTKYVDNYYFQKDLRNDFNNLTKSQLKSAIQKSYHDL